MNGSLTGLIGERYQIVQKVAEGGMGELYLVRDMKLNGALRALKILKESDPELERWIQQEAVILTRLAHRCLPIIYDYTTFESRPYVVMEWIDGIQLGQLLQERTKPLPLSYIAYVAVEVLEALSYLHTQQPPIIHRDLKPANIMLAKDGSIKLIDFGISKQLGNHKDYTALFGTRGYSSPEQLSGRSTDERTDIYSFGALLLKLLGLEPSKWLPNGRVERSLIRRLSAYPKGWKELIISCLQEHPEDRTASVSIVLNDINKLRSVLEPSDFKTTDKRVQYVGKRIAIVSTHRGAGATLVSLSLCELYRDAGLSYAHVEHRLNEGELIYCYRPSHQDEAQASLVDEQLQCASVGSGRHFLNNPLEDESGVEEERLARTNELITAMALQQDVIIDYSSHWTEKAIEVIVQHSDMIIVVDSPWTLKQTPRGLYRLHELLKRASEREIEITWVHNRDQQFAGRSAWYKLANGLPCLTIPELPSKLVLRSLAMEHCFPPYSTLSKQIKKYLMSLIKSYVRLQ